MSHENINRPIMIELEGLDGSGKTTAMKFVVNYLKEKGFPVLETREVGSPHVPFAVKLREIVLDPNANLRGETMEFLFAAMRLESQKFYESVAHKYDFIVSDRGFASHLAYTDHNVNEAFTEEFYGNIVSALSTPPDVVLYLDVDPDVALARRVRRGETPDAIEIKGVEFQKKVGESFKKYLNSGLLSDSVVTVVDANRELQVIQKEISEILEDIIELRDLLTNNTEELSQ